MCVNVIAERFVAFVRVEIFIVAQESLLVYKEHDYNMYSSTRRNREDQYSAMVSA